MLINDGCTFHPLLITTLWGVRQEEEKNCKRNRIFSQHLSKENGEMGSISTDPTVLICIFWVVPSRLQVRK